MGSRKLMGLRGGRHRPQVGISAHLLSGEAGYRRAGIHQYIAQCLHHLPWEVDGPDYLLYSRTDAGLADQPGVSVVTSWWPTEHRWARIAWEQLVGPVTAVNRRLDLWHSMAFVSPSWLPCPAVVTVYDLSFIRYPDSFPFLQRLYLSSQTRRSCRQAARIITISESGRQDVHRFFGIPLAKIDVVRPGVEPVYQPLPEEQVALFRQRMGLTRPFILHVGTLQPRKNIPMLLEAFSRADLTDMDLVLVGGKGWLFDNIFQQVDRLGLAEKVRFPGYVPDEDLPFWYNAAELFVFPSLYEGFGLPVVEAMACGTPVIAANSSSIPEAAGEAAILFDPADPDELADRMTAVLHDKKQSVTMRARGLQQATSFTWEQAGRGLAAVYRRALIQK